MNNPRRQARAFTLQILYFWEVGGADVDAAIDAFFAEHQPDADPDVIEFASRIARGTVGEVADLDRRIAQHSQHWRIERLAVIDRLILRMALWELGHAADTPAAVTLNEAIELARRFSGEDSARFVNGVLDGIRKSIPVAQQADGP